MSKKHTLMIPGPVEVHPDVLHVLSEPVEPHYGGEWVNTYRKVIKLLMKVFKTEQDVLLLAGSGSSGLDASVGSALQSGEKIVICNNGFFGDRLVAIAKEYGLNIVQVQAKWGEKIQPSTIEEALAKHPDTRMVAVVHSETSTTVLNPVKEIAEIVRKTKAIFMVDAVSSLGGVALPVDDWGVDLCVSASQKCLGSIPGFAPVMISDKGWDCIKRSYSKMHGWFSNLQTWKKFSVDWGDWHPTPITVSSNVVKALLVALEMLLEEGTDNRMARYTTLALQLRNGLRNLGLQLLTPDDELNPVLTAAYTPAGIDSNQIVDFLRDDHQIYISTGLGAFKQTTFRVGHMSPILTSDDIEKLLSALGNFMG